MSDSGLADWLCQEIAQFCMQTENYFFEVSYVQFFCQIVDLFFIFHACFHLSIAGMWFSLIVHISHHTRKLYRPWREWRMRT